MSQENLSSKTAVPFVIHSLSLDQAKKLVNAYTEINKFSASYTQSVWFPINLVTKIALQLHLEEADGVRIYFGRYTSEFVDEENRLLLPEDRIPEDYKNRNTVVLVSTRTIDGIPRRDYFSSDYGSDRMDPQNRGLLCPPGMGCDEESPLFDV